MLRLAVNLILSSIVFCQTAKATEVRRIGDAISFRAHSGMVKSIGLTERNTSIFATADDEGEVAVWDRTTLSPYWRATIGDFDTAIAFSHTGRLLAAGGQCQMMLLDTNDGYPVMSFDTGTPSGGCNINWDEPDFLRFSANDETLFAGFTDRIFQLDTTNGRIAHIYGDIMGEGYQFWNLKDFILSANEAYLFTLDELQFRVYLVATGELVRNFDLSAVAGLDNVDISRGGLTTDGLQFVVADQMYIYVVDTVMQRVERRILAAADRITSAGITENHCCVMLSSADGTTRVYEIATGEEWLRLDDTRPSNTRTWQTAVNSFAGSGEAMTGDAAGFIWIWKTPQ
jgi:WD40 repeat protein